MDSIFETGELYVIGRYPCVVFFECVMDQVGFAGDIEFGLDAIAVAADGMFGNSEQKACGCVVDSGAEDGEHPLFGFCDQGLVPPGFLNHRNQVWALVSFSFDDLLQGLAESVRIFRVCIDEAFELVFCHKGQQSVVLSFCQEDNLPGVGAGNQFWEVIQPIQRFRSGTHNG